MGDLAELALTAVILVVGFLCAPLVIDRIPILAAQVWWVKTALCFVFAGALFVGVIFAWAAVLKLNKAMRKRPRG
jgi:hypothetical protein